MELSLKVFIFCCLHQILPTSCSSSSSEENEEWNGVKGGSETEQIENNSSKEVPNNRFQNRLPEPQYEAELKAGDPADLFGSNQHHSYPPEYKHFGRRFVPVYPYTEDSKQKSENEELLPIESAPEKVLAVAMQSAIDQALRPVNSEADKKQKDILRSGDYWNAVWVEDVDPKSVLRSYTRNHLLKEKQKRYKSNAPKLESVRAKIMPGSNLYRLVSVLKQFSPRLLYVINNNE